MTTLKDIKNEMLNLPQKSYGWWVQTPWKKDDVAIEYAMIFYKTYKI